LLQGAALLLAHNAGGGQDHRQHEAGLGEYAGRGEAGVGEIGVVSDAHGELPAAAHGIAVSHI